MYKLKAISNEDVNELFQKTTKVEIRANIGRGVALH